VTTPPSPLAGSTVPTSPFAEGGNTADNALVDVTPTAVVKLKELRDMEPETTQLGLRVEIISAPGEDFRYDLSFEKVTTAAFTDEVRTVDGLKVIIPSKDVDLLRGADRQRRGAVGAQRQVGPVQLGPAVGAMGLQGGLRGHRAEVYRTGGAPFSAKP